LLVDAREVDVDWKGGEGQKVKAKAEKRREFKFDLLIGANSIKSEVRMNIIFHVIPRPPTGNCPYRAIVHTLQQDTGRS